MSWYHDDNMDACVRGQTQLRDSHSSLRSQSVDGQRIRCRGWFPWCH